MKSQSYFLQLFANHSGDCNSYLSIYLVIIYINFKIFIPI